MNMRIHSIIGVTGILSAGLAYALTPPVNFPVGTFPIAIAAADLGNGFQDIVVANYGSNNVTVLLGDGAGNFAAAVGSPYLVGFNPHSIVIADVNGDSKKDLIVANVGSNTVSVLLGNGNGTFMAAVSYLAGTLPYSVDVGNFNGGRKDIVVANEFGGIRLVPGKNPAGTFDAPITVPYPVGLLPTSLVVGDYDNDGNKDIAIANASGGANGVIILFGKGDGTFKAPVSIAVGPRPFSIMADDLDGDGNLDLAVTDYIGGVYVLFGKNSPKGTFNAPQFYATGSVPTSVASGDFTHHLLKDLVVANSFSSSVSVLMQMAAPSQLFFPAVNTPLGFFSLPDAVAIARFNGDNKTDVAVANYFSNTVSVLLGN
jgi:hypothetical protein